MHWRPLLIGRDAWHQAWHGLVPVAPSRRKQRERDSTGVRALSSGREGHGEREPGRGDWIAPVVTGKKVSPRSGYSAEV